MRKGTTIVIAPLLTALAAAAAPQLGLATR